jgi:hypothetical protein
LREELCSDLPPYRGGVCRAEAVSEWRGYHVLLQKAVQGAGEHGM